MHQNDPSNTHPSSSADQSLIDRLSEENIKLRADNLNHEIYRLEERIKISEKEYDSRYTLWSRIKLAFITLIIASIPGLLIGKLIWEELGGFFILLALIYSALCLIAPRGTFLESAYQAEPRHDIERLKITLETNRKELASIK